eukprot:scaffold5707_cov112-Cylindrotheca_fusiformis.AAC.14
MKNQQGMISSFWASAILIMASANAAMFNDCGLSEYYSDFPSDISSVTPEQARASAAILSQSKHRNAVPNIVDNVGSGDIYAALITLDNGSIYQNFTAANETVRLLFKDDFAPIIPFAGNGWQKEWIWPLNRGICEDVLNCTGKDISDLHNIRPTSKLSKAVRASKYFAGCDLLLNGGDCMTPAEDGAESTCSCNRAYQPPESDRGAIARTLMYMDVRYDGTDGLPDLVLADCPFNAPFDFAYLSQMIEWNEQYPPTEEEILRNELVCSEYQGNRNPFIDYPDLASVIYGDPLPDPAPDRENYEVCDDLTTSAPTNSPNECDMILPGDVFVFMINSANGPSQIAFWNYEDLPGDTEIFMTDRSWSEADSSFDTSSDPNQEGTIKFTTPSEGIPQESITGRGSGLPFGNSWSTVEGAFFISSQGEQIFLYCIGALGKPVLMSGIVYGPNAGDEQFTVPERLRERGYIKLVGPYPNWLYDGPKEGSDKAELEAARKDPDNWFGTNERVSRLCAGPCSFCRSDSLESTEGQDVDTRKLILVLQRSDLRKNSNFFQQFAVYQH